MDKHALMAALANMGIMAISEQGQRDLIGKLLSAPADLRSHVPLKQSSDGEIMTLAQFLERVDRIETRSEGTTVVLPIRGVLEYQSTLLGWWYGGTSYRAIGRALDEAVQDNRVERVILEMDSPGGTVVGLREIAEKIYSLRDTIDIVSVANPMAASAALRIATAARQFYTLGSAWALGSIGTITATWSWAQYFKEEGIDYRVFSNPLAKGDGHPAREINDEYVAWLESEIKKHSDDFRAAVAKYRNVPVNEVDSRFGGGRTITGEDAKKVQLVDGIATIEQVLAKPIKKMNRGKRMAESQSQPPSGRGRAEAYED